MNYIAEIKAFYDWLETNKLPTSSIALWHALMHIANKTGWQDNFAVAVSVLEIKTGLKRQSIYDARNKLKNAGLLDFESRNGNQSAIYTMNPFISAEQTQTHTQELTASVKRTQTPTQSHTQPHTQYHTQTPTINKLNETKLNEKDITPLNPPKGKNGGKSNSQGQFVEQIKSYTGNNALREALTAFAEMRKKIKKPLTEHGLKILLNRLDKLAANEKDKLEIVNNSVASCWQGFFKLEERSGQRGECNPNTKQDNSTDSWGIKVTRL